MRPLTISQDIVPLGEFKAKAASILRALPERNGPLVITQNGRAACVVLSPEAFDQLRAREAFLESVAEGLSDAMAGRVVSDDQLGEVLDTEFGPLHRE